MNEKKYLVDNNALGFIGPRRRSSAFFREHCRVTEDVAWEARYTVKPAVLRGLQVATTPIILNRVPGIMRTVPVGDIRLLNLYSNKGAADPLIVATALALQEKESESLLGDEWIVVTNDGALTAKAKEFGVATAAAEDLAELIDRDATAHS